MTLLLSYSKYVLGLFILVVITGCSGLPSLNNASELMDNEIVLVGRIELVPPLEKVEEATMSVKKENRKANAVFFIGQIPIENLSMPGMDAVKSAAAIDLGKDFYIRVPRSEKLIYSGTTTLAKITGGIVIGDNATITSDSLVLPGGISFKVDKHDRALYFGTIRYHRDDYNAITNVKVIDKFSSTQKMFVKKFGDTLKLKRAKLEQI